jgi:excisionase family DNA binding protein
MTVTEEHPAVLLRPEAAAKVLSISRSKLYRLIQEGRIPATRVAGSVRVPIRALEAYIEASTTWPQAPVTSTER